MEYLKILAMERKNRELQFEHEVKMMQNKAHQNMIQLGLDVSVAQITAELIALSWAIKNDI